MREIETPRREDCRLREVLRAAGASNFWRRARLWMLSVGFKLEESGITELKCWRRGLFLGKDKLVGFGIMLKSGFSKR